VTIRNSLADVSLHLPNGHLSMARNPASSEYRITFGGSAGQLQWSNARLTLDKFQLKSTLARSGFAVDSLQVVSEGSRAEVSGLVAGTPARVDTRGTFDLDLQHLSRVLGLTTPLQGRIQSTLAANGPSSALQFRGRLFADAMVVHGTTISRPAAEVLLDTATGELQLDSVS